MFTMKNAHVVLNIGVSIRITENSQAPLQYFIRGFATHEIYRGYSNFLLNMAFISSSEVETIYMYIS